MSLGITNCGWNSPSYYGPPAETTALRELKCVRDVAEEGDTVTITTGTPRQAKLLKTVLEPSIDGKKVRIQSEGKGTATAPKAGEIKTLLEDLTAGTVTTDGKTYTIGTRSEEVKWADGLVKDKIGRVPVRIQATSRGDYSSESW